MTANQQLPHHLNTSHLPTQRSKTMQISKLINAVNKIWTFYEGRNKTWCFPYNSQSKQHLRNQGSTICMATNLRDGQSRHYGLIPGAGARDLSLLIGSGTHPGSYQVGVRPHLQGVHINWDVKPHPVPRLRICGAVLHSSHLPSWYAQERLHL